MHSEDGEEDLKIASYYGSATTIAGILFAGAIITLMFFLADGFS
ncbi:MAG: hypothetical protein AAGK00_16830 [Pseudomonadota bacterium]